MEIKNITGQGEERVFQVYHKKFYIKKDDYYRLVHHFHEPFSQTALQHIVTKYLEENNDNGLVGMVRYKEEGDGIILDAAIRYLQ
ncbi:hypothetical protein [Anaerobranca gottschalkii]|uniref:Uncharacterized protein n=1 Tax=Anaerobranca gottschalkii DSM 13577 TaxID=1120990 RepID=A0A1I0BMD6_9FIRM|nr:hypothetical protein [Anaerobranca gottschalkii]SET08191.1 hypothetical protein SAMN03080614_10443 [Anaerobranca gottschalkii DSM 13577]